MAPLTLFFISLFVLALMAPTVYAAAIGAPFVATSRARRKEILNLLELKPGDIVYDLGAGAGDMMLLFAKKHGIKVIGFELSPLLYAITQLRIFFHGTNNASLRWRNFFRTDLSPATVVYCYLVPKAIEKLRNKFERELKQGTKIVSFAFPIKWLEPYATISGGGMPKVFFYRI